MTDELDARLAAVERAVTGDETDFTAIADAATVDERLAAVEGRLDEIETRLADLDATTQATRGYLSGVDGVTADVERQAALALAKVEAVESHVFEADEGLSVERLASPEDDTRTTPEGLPEHAPNGHATDRDAPPRSLATRLRDAL